MNFQLSCFLVVCCIVSSSAFLGPQFKKFALEKLPELKVKTNNIALVAYSSFLVSTPSIVHAEDGGGQTAVLVPLLISALTIAPFLYYQQALKPKERKVQQIELDEYLRPVKYDKKGKKIE